jgi:hypothetical protein
MTAHHGQVEKDEDSSLKNFTKSSRAKKKEHENQKTRISKAEPVKKSVDCLTNSMEQSPS